jgi:hypothetical protein
MGGVRFVMARGVGFVVPVVVVDEKEEGRAVEWIERGLTLGC